MSTNFAKTLVWKHECDVRLRRHKDRTPQTNDHHMPLNESPHENFLRPPLFECLLFSLFKGLLTDLAEMALSGEEGVGTGVQMPQE